MINVLKAQSGWQLVLASAGVFGLLLLLNGFPALGQNEGIYLVHGRRLVFPDFLNHDWTFGRDQPRLNIVFSALIAGLWLIFDNVTTVAVTTRVVVWSALLAAIMYFGRSCRFPPLVTAAGLCILIAYDLQSLAAGEWLFNGAEQKVLAYSAVIFSLALIMRGRYAAAGVAAGVALWCHVLVGGWSGLALAAAVLARTTRFSLRPFVAFALPAGLIAAMAAVYYLYQIIPSGSPSTAGADAGEFWRYYATVRAPHHLDPHFFIHDGIHLFGLFVIFVSSLGLGWISLPRHTRAPVTVFSSVISVFFLGGLLARELEWFSVLNLYPFRVADTLIPLLCAIFAAGLVWQALRADPSTTTRRNAVVLLVPLFAVLLLLAATQSPAGLKVLRRPAWSVLESVQRWQDLARGERADDFLLMAHWIRARTSSDATFAADPCELRFWLYAQRALVVTWKGAPVSASLTPQWTTRITALLGEPEPGEHIGSLLCSQASRERFNQLPVEALATIRDRFDADYYLSGKERPELQDTLVHQVGNQYLYRLD